MEIIEKEIKYCLSSFDYVTLLDYLNQTCLNKNVNEQINYYIDTMQMDLMKAGISARIRSIDEKFYEFTIKSGTLGNDKNVSIKREYTINLEKLAGERYIQGEAIYNFFVNTDDVNAYVNQLGIDMTLLTKLKILGQLATTRTFFKLEEQFAPINLDYSRYFNHEDYEIEWETEDIEGAMSRLWIILNELNIKPLPEMLTKKARFTKALLGSFHE